jgi:CheY-like chemotaxis protein
VSNITPNKWHIVVADDDADWRALMLSAVASAGPSVTAVNDGLQLVAECRRMLDSTDRCLLVLSDLEMPGLSGLDAMAALPELGSRVHVVLVTGVSSREELARAGAAGAAVVLHKPVSRRALLDAIAGVLS